MDIETTDKGLELKELNKKAQSALTLSIVALVLSIVTFGTISLPFAIAALVKCGRLKKLDKYNITRSKVGAARLCAILSFIVPIIVAIGLVFLFVFVILPAILPVIFSVFLIVLEVIVTAFANGASNAFFEWIEELLLEYTLIIGVI